MLLLYIRIFATRSFRLICWSFVAINVANLISVILSVLLICDPILYSYDRTIPGGRCGDLTKFQLYTAIFNLLADFIIVVLPMPMLWRLQMQRKRKIGITLVFGMGFMSVSSLFFL